MTGWGSPIVKVRAGIAAGIVATALVAAVPAIVEAVGSSGLPAWLVVFLTAVITNGTAYLKTETSPPTVTPTDRSLS